MLQSKLSFPIITADDAHKQKRLLAEQFALEHPPTVTASIPPGPPLKQPVGRPKRRLEINEALTAPTSSQPIKKTRGSYTSWFASPFIDDILREYKRCDYNAHRTAAKKPEADTTPVWLKGANTTTTSDAKAASP